jgi:hypothetical protein
MLSELVVGGVVVGVVGLSLLCVDEDVKAQDRTLARARTARKARESSDNLLKCICGVYEKDIR